MANAIKLPEGFSLRMREFLGDEEYTSFEESYHREQLRALRVNSLKLTPEQFLCLAKDAFPEFTGEKVPWTDNGFYYPDTMRPGKHPYHEAGLFYIQEPSAMSAAALSGAEPGERILDLCAAPGGKTTEVAARMQGEGLLVTNEISPERARILSENVERCGIKNAIVTNMDSATLAEHFSSFFDRILVDAPCSGEGMFVKEEAALTGWSLENIRLCAARQSEILEDAAKMLCEGGTLIYSTCTFAPEENEGTLGRFLKAHPEFTIEELKEDHFAPAHPKWDEDAADFPEIKKAGRLWPHRLKGEGHFLAILRKSGVSVRKVLTDKVKCADAAALKLFAEFKESALMDFEAPEDRIVRFGDELYLLPDRLSLRGLKVLRAGLDLGTVKKDRFEPSHALALALKPEEIKNRFELMDEEKGIDFKAALDLAVNYLKGLTLTTDDLKTKGYTVITLQGFPLGWAKASGGVLKNHYPKGLRWM